MASIWQRLKRLVRHRWWDEGDVRRALPADVLQHLAARVATSEQHHSGEIRICVEGGLPLGYLWHDLTARQRAVTMFGKLRVWDTAHNNGVLIYLLMAEHAIEIVADRGLNAHVSPAQWQALVHDMRSAFRAGQFEQGLLSAVDVVDALLAQHFALAPGQTNPNELPDAPYLR